MATCPCGEEVPLFAISWVFGGGSASCRRRNGGCTVGVKWGNKGGEKRCLATAHTVRRPCFPFPLICECAPFRKRSERNLQLAMERHIIHRTSTTYENNSLQIPTSAHTGFYVKFDKENGSFMKLGQPTGLHTSAFPRCVRVQV